MSSTAKLGVIVGPTRYLDPASGRVRHTLDLVDLDASGLSGPAPEPERIALEFFAHGFASSPKEPARAALFEKRGPGGAYVDLRTLEVVCAITPLAGHAFYGHGAFSADGSALFAVEMNLATQDGVISVRDPASFACLGQFPSYGAAPHDCHLVEDGKVLMITNGGGPLGDPRTPSVTFVDVASQALLEKLEVDDDRINAGHAALLCGRELALVSAPRDGLPEDTNTGGVSLRRRGGRLLHLFEPREVTRRFLGESLSVAIHEASRSVFATHPFGGLATLWSFDDGALLAAIDVPSARGVTLSLDQRFFAVSAGAQAGLLLFEASPFRLVEGRDEGRARFGGSHIYTWDRHSATRVQPS